MKTLNGVVDLIVNDNSISNDEKVLMLKIMEYIEPFENEFIYDERNDTLATMLSVSERSIQKYLKNLIKSDFIIIRSFGRMRNVICLHERIKDMFLFENHMLIKKELELWKNNELTNRENTILAKIIKMTPKQQELTEFYIDTMIKNI